MALALTAVLAASAPATAAGPDHATAPTALVVLLRAGPGDTTERALQSLPAFSIGLLSTAQGEYTPARMLEDLDRAARLAHATGRDLTVLSLPTAGEDYARLRALVRRRRPGELVLALERSSGTQAHELRWAGLAGAGAAGMLSSLTTRERGLIAAVDVAPTLLAHLELPIPASLHGKPIQREGRLDGARLRALKARLEVVYPRRLPALACLLGAWTLLLAFASTPLSPSTRAARLRRALRVGALMMLWMPVAALLPAALAPSAAAEYALIVGGALALAALTDRLVPWPRAPVAPAAAAVVALSIDAIAGTQLLMRSLLGPNPAYGSRFYGIGNELKPALAVLVFAAVASCLHRSERSRRGAMAMAAAGTLLAAVEGSALIGAGVGGVVLVSAGAAVATVLLLPGSFDRRRLLAILAAPLLGLVLLAALDLATAKGAGHFTGSVLEAHSFADLRELVASRYRAAWRELGNGLMPLATAAAVLLVIVAVYRRDRMMSPAASHPAWQAAFAGGISTGVVGALVEDSGPVLLLVAVFTLACVLGYLWGDPAPATAIKPYGRSSREASRDSAVSRGAIPALPPQHDLVL